MAAPRLLPSDSTLAKWRAEGLTMKQMAQRIKAETGVDVSVSSIGAALSRAGLTNRVRYDDHIPWNPIKTEHNKSYPLSMLRLLARRDGGMDLSQDQDARLDAWLERMDSEDAVVLYRYDSEDGFYYVKRKPSDKGYIRPPKPPRKG
jgi:hypothetical protein